MGQWGYVAPRGRKFPRHQTVSSPIGSVPVGVPGGAISDTADPALLSKVGR